MLATVSCPTLADGDLQPDYGCVVAYTYICFPEVSIGEWTMPCPDSAHPCHGNVVGGGHYIDVSPSESGWTLGSFEVETHFVFYRLPTCVNGECGQGSLMRWECPQGFTMKPFMAECPADNGG